MKKQKIVIKVFVNGEKARRKALKIAVSLTGVESAALGEKDKNQIEVVGREDVDAAKLTYSLRKKLSNWPHLGCFLKSKMAYAELVSVAKVEPKAEEKPKETNPNPIVWQCPPPPPFPYYAYCHDDPCSCSIM